MNVRELIDVLKRFPPEAPVRLSINWPDSVTETYEGFSATDSGGVAEINAGLDLRGQQVYVGCAFRQRTPGEAAPK